MNKKFKFEDDLTSDVLFRAFGENEKELFENAAEALFSVICEIDNIEAGDCHEVSMQAENLEDLMYKWLTTLIGYVDTHEVFFKTFNVTEITNYSLKAQICGEPIDVKKGLVQVKAITYYKFGIEKTSQGFIATISCDI